MKVDDGGHANRLSYNMKNYVENSFTYLVDQGMLKNQRFWFSKLKRNFDCKIIKM